MLSLETLNNITPPRVPLTDPRTGYIAREWYLFFLSQFSRSRDLTAESNTNQTDLEATNAALAETQAELDALADQVDGAGLAPIYTPQLSRLRYGSFYDTTTQTAAVINTAYAMTFNATDLSQGVYLGTPTSRVYVDTANVYNIQFSAQLDKTAGGVGIVWIWLRKNGTDVANSASQVRIQGNDAELVAAWNFLLPMNAGDYFELMWEVDTTTIEITTFAASGVHPAIPSVILTVTDNISA
jgi:hypothetical protein